MSAKTTHDSPLAIVASGIEERRCDLISRHRNLRNKVTTMERSIPALMAYNMWMVEQDCRDAPYCKMRKIMNKFSPQPDPVDRLLAELRSTLNDLQQETSQLHDKIIDADVELEETSMKLESLELANKEMEEKLIELRNEVNEMQRHNTPSLHSIHSEDLICLKKIRQLAEEELKLKNYIKELESKEITFRQLMGKFLSCKEFQHNNRKIIKRMQNLRESDRKLHYPLEDHKHNIHVTKKKHAFKDKRQKTCCSCSTSVTLIDYEKTSKKSCCVPLDIRTTTDKSHDCKGCCKSCQQISAAILKSKIPCSMNPPCKSLLSIASKTGVPQSFKQLTQSSVPCNLGKTCNECETPAACKQINNCKCDCEGKCAHKLSIASCDCDVTPLDKTYQSMTSEMLHLELEIDDSNSDEDFCECCFCGCAGSTSENSS